MPYCTIFNDGATSLTLCHVNTRTDYPTTSITTFIIDEDDIIKICLLYFE